MNVWIVYDSKFGNNKKIAELLGEYLKEGNNVQVSHAKKISPKKVVDAGIDMFLFGGPIHAGHISFTMEKWAKKLAKLLNKKQILLKKAAVWGSHAKNDDKTPPQFSWDATKLKWKTVLDLFPAEKKLSDVTGFDIIPTTIEGPLEPGWEDLTKELADKVKNL